MPNVGRPSRDCHLCRQRRVKCDLGQPQCNRCIRLGRICPGYRDESDLLFHVEDPTSFAESATRDRRRKRPTPPDEASASPRRPSNSSSSGVSSPTPLDPDIVVFSGWYLSPSKQLAECWDLHALPLALSAVCRPMAHRRPFGFLGFLPEMIAKSEQNSSIVLCCRAIAQAFLTCKVRTPEEQSRRTMAYGEALKATNLALRDPALQVQDETLGSIWLLSLYELIVQPSEFSPPLGAARENQGVDSWIVHTQGLVGLIRLRGQSSFESPVSRGLFWLVYVSIIVRSFITNTESPTDSLTWFQNAEKHLLEDELSMYHLSVYGHRASTICARVRTFLKDDRNDSPTAVAHILADAEHLEAETQETRARHPDVFEKHDKSLDAEFDFRFLCSRAFFDAYRLKLQLSLFQLLNKARARITQNDWAPFEGQTSQCLGRIQTLADNILSVVPVLTGSHDFPGTSHMFRPRFWADGVRLLWPLRLVAYWEPTRDDQKRLAVSALQHIRLELGLRPGSTSYMSKPYESR